MHFENITHYASLFLYAVMMVTLIGSLMSYVVYKYRVKGNSKTLNNGYGANENQLSSQSPQSLRYSEVTLVSAIQSEFRPVRVRKNLRFG